ncbi:MAG: hypothetical protein IKU03_07725 [Bacteroidales bacterium]|nr:hypothetical protein [Bacteroidales bacterium]
MKKTFSLQYLPAILGIFLMICFAACKPEPVDPTPEELVPIEYTPEVQEPITNDFTLLKACIGKSFSEVAALLADHGFTAAGENKFLKTENGVTKEATIYSPGSAALTLQDTAFDVLKQGFTQWMNEIRNSVVYTKLVRSSFELSTGWNNGYQHFNTPEELLAALVPVSLASGMSASFSGNDIYYYQYGLSMMPDLGGVYMQIINSHVGQPLDEFTGDDLETADLQKHILISKVDYLTFRYKGFYALNVSDKLNTGNEIPFVSEYQEPGDFGYIKLFYRNTNNLLMDGTIIWSGCGALSFPASFRAGQALNSGLPYPGQSRFAFIDNGGQYTTVSDDNELQRVWQTVSRQQEFQHYYGNSSKKVAVYRYTPSVGVGNPADWYYLVFTEQ